MTRNVFRKTYGLRVISQARNFDSLDRSACLGANMTHSHTVQHHAIRSGAVFFGALFVLMALQQLLAEADSGKLTGNGRAAHQVVKQAQTAGREVDAKAPAEDLFFHVKTYDSGGQLGWSGAVADLNGDGKQELVVVNYGGGTDGGGSVGVLLGHGDGTFQPAVSYNSAGGGPTSVAVGDLNNDGKLDLVVANQGCPPVSTDCLGVLLGNGDGSFQPAVIYATDGQGAIGSATISTPILIMDVNNDGKPDLVVANQTDKNYGDGRIGILLGRGDGTFLSVVTYDSGGFVAFALAVADLNGDGKPDLAVVNCAPPGNSGCPNKGELVGVLLNRGNGTFGPARTYATKGRVAGGGGHVVVADLNGDGEADLIVGNSCDLSNGGACTNHGSVGVLLGKGNGSFRPVVTYDSGGDDASSLAVVDVDGDGTLDVVVGNGHAGVLRGNGDGTFRLVDAYPGTGEANHVQVVDINGDGILDLIESNLTASSVDVLLGNGTGFGLPLTFQSGGFYLLGLAVADVNADERPDLILTNWCPNIRTCKVGKDERGTVGVLLNNDRFQYAGTTTRLASTEDPAPPNETITYTATVTNPSGDALTGSVVFSDGGTTFAQADLLNNQAAVRVSYPTPTTHAIQATYSGNTNNAGSTSQTLAEYITPRLASATEVTTSGSPSQAGQTVTFTASVASKHGSIPDGELVNFFDGGKSLGSAALSNGTAAFSTSSLSAKTHTIKAVYPGDTAFKKSHGIAVQVVEP